MKSNLENRGGEIRPMQSRSEEYKLQNQKVYTVHEDMFGLFLVKSSDLELLDEKDILNLEDFKRKCAKIVKLFNEKKKASVLLSGVKGTGKTVLLKHAAIASGRPIIAVNSTIQPTSLKNFLSDVKQECVVIFDEFEKYYEDKLQEQLLSLFDGVGETNHKFILSSNDKLSEYFTNRPGRIYYNFKYSGLTIEEIKETIKHISPKIYEDDKMLKEILLHLMFVKDISYDMIVNILEDIERNGESFAKVFEEINIERTNIDFNIEIEEEGNVFEGTWLVRQNRKDTNFTYAYPSQVTIEKNKVRNKEILEAQKLLDSGSVKDSKKVEELVKLSTEQPIDKDYERYYRFDNIFETLNLCEDNSLEGFAENYDKKQVKVKLTRVY